MLSGKHFGQVTLDSNRFTLQEIFFYTVCVLVQFSSGIFFSL